MSLVSDSSFADLFRSSLADLGLPADDSHRLSVPLPPSLPRSLKALYLVAGQHPINGMHHRLLLPNQLDRRGGKVIFAEENQQTIVWAFDESDGVDDPEVWQGQLAAGGLDEGIVWYSEELPLSRFVVEMWTWTVTGESSTS